ncbi:DUF3558 domain-containing protein [Prauserella oleivorans]|uniref:DUF3558 domain-containing protein n=1 Tax=Prauserella oleivorans TaxID=1478153 RepID=A0ABW5W6F0_9PSEU
MKRVCGALAIAGAFLVSGCSESSPGEAAPTPQTATTQPPTSAARQVALPHSGAPSVSNPLPESVLAGDPCNALTRAQVEDALGSDAPAGEPGTGATGRSCRWQDTESGAGFTVFYGNVVRQGLSSYYQNTQPQASRWEPLSPIEGHPAVAFQMATDDLTCQVVVGLSDKLTAAVNFAVGRSAVGKVDPCEAARLTAQAMLTNFVQSAGN